MIKFLLRYDNVQILENSSVVAGPYCGFEHPEVYLSNGNSVQISFHSDAMIDVTSTCNFEIF